VAYEPSSLVKHSWSNPPRCLSAVNATPITDPKEDHEAFSHFALSCNCGARQWRVLGYLAQADLLLCPLTLSCSGCDFRAEIFDVEKHGYDAELNNGCYSRRAEGEEGPYSCSECKGQSFTATAVMSYQLDEEEIDEAMRPKRQDLFDTFCLAVSCSDCGQASSVCEYECA